MFVSKVVLKAVSRFFMYLWYCFYVFVDVMIILFRCFPSCMPTAHSSIKVMICLRSLNQRWRMWPLWCVYKISGFFWCHVFFANPTMKLLLNLLGTRFSRNTSNSQNLIHLSYDFKVKKNFCCHSKPLLFIKDSSTTLLYIV